MHHYEDRNESNPHTVEDRFTSKETLIDQRNAARSEARYLRKRLEELQKQYGALLDEQRQDQQVRDDRRSMSEKDAHS